MVDRQKLETILVRRFPGATPEQIAAAANAIMGLDDEWEEVPEMSKLAEDLRAGIEFRLLRRRTAS